MGRTTLQRHVVLRRLRDVHPPQWNDLLISRIEIVVMVQDELHEFVAIDQTKIAPTPREFDSLPGEAAQSDQ